MNKEVSFSIGVRVINLITWSKDLHYTVIDVRDHNKCQKQNETKVSSVNDIVVIINWL